MPHENLLVFVVLYDVVQPKPHQVRAFTTTTLQFYTKPGEHCEANLQVLGLPWFTYLCVMFPKEVAFLAYVLGVTSAETKETSHSIEKCGCSKSLPNIWH